jgi:hypothetical protein
MVDSDLGVADPLSQPERTRAQSDGVPNLARLLRARARLGRSSSSRPASRPTLGLGGRRTGELGEERSGRPPCSSRWLLESSAQRWASSLVVLVRGNIGGTEAENPPATPAATVAERSARAYWAALGCAPMAARAAPRREAQHRLPSRLPPQCASRARSGAPPAEHEQRERLPMEVVSVGGATPDRRRAGSWRATPSRSELNIPEVRRSSAHRRPRHHRFRAEPPCGDDRDRLEQGHRGGSDALRGRPRSHGVRDPHPPASTCHEERIAAGLPVEILRVDAIRRGQSGNASDRSTSAASPWAGCKLAAGSATDARGRARRGSSRGRGRGAFTLRPASE